MAGGLEGRLLREQIESQRLANAQAAMGLGDPGQMLQNLARMQAIAQQEQMGPAQLEQLQIQNEFAPQLAQSQIEGQQGPNEYRRQLPQIEQIRNQMAFLDLIRPFGGAESMMQQVGRDLYGLEGELTAPVDPTVAMMEMLRQGEQEQVGPTPEQLERERLIMEAIQNLNQQR